MEKYIRPNQVYPGIYPNSPNPYDHLSTLKFIYTRSALAIQDEEYLRGIYTQIDFRPNAYSKEQLINLLAGRPLSVIPLEFNSFLLGAYVNTRDGEFLIRSPVDLFNIRGTGTIRRFNLPSFDTTSHRSLSRSSSRSSSHSLSQTEIPYYSILNPK